MNSKNILVLAFVVFLVAVIPSGLANDIGNTSHEEDTGIGHQFEEILPFHHFGEGHIFAGTVLILLWLSFFYTIYSIFQILRKKNNKT